MIAASSTCTVFFRWIPIRWALSRFQHGTHPSSCRSKIKVGRKANCQTMPTMKIGLEVISSWVCCSAPNGDLRVQISLCFLPKLCQFCFGTLLCKLKCIYRRQFCQIQYINWAIQWSMQKHEFEFSQWGDGVARPEGRVRVISRVHVRSRIWEQVRSATENFSNGIL